MVKVKRFKKCFTLHLPRTPFHILRIVLFTERIHSIEIQMWYQQKCELGKKSFTLSLRTCTVRFRVSTYNNLWLNAYMQIFETRFLYCRLNVQWVVCLTATKLRNITRQSTGTRLLVGHCSFSMRPPEMVTKLSAFASPHPQPVFC